MNIKGIIRGFFFALIISAALLVAGAALTYFNLIDERTASIIAFAGAAAGVFIGALGAAKTAENKILLNAMLVSLLFCILILFVTLGINGGFTLRTRSITMLSSIMASGFLGAMFGK
ncbi:MAG: TIGR04086 family membrane protein [Clostridiales bacterium]|nr:TIGR04086 family membrane protein [Clostridiales bacterium]